MRSKSTNILQGIVLITGILYIVIGLSLYISPLAVLKLFAENISENWLDLVKDHELVGPLYYAFRGFSALLLTSGIAMVMPLFDPLKYRGLVYYNGLLFPFLASIMLVKNGLIIFMFEKQPLSTESTPALHSQQGHLLVALLGVVFSIICISNAVGLVLTKKEARDGVE